MIRRLLLLSVLLLPALVLAGDPGLPELSKSSAKRKFEEIMKSHVSHQRFTAEVAERALINYVELTDPAKTYLLFHEVRQWLEPGPTLLEKVLRDYQRADYSEFESIYDAMSRAIKRRNQLERELDTAELPTDVEPTEFEDMEWCKDTNELRTRLLRLRGLRAKVAENLDYDKREVALKRVAKRRAAFEEDYTQLDQLARERFILVNFLKSGAGALDSQTAYFTPGEAEQFMINVQQRLFGIGAQLRDDLNGFSVVKIIEGGPAFRGGKLQENDRIIAVDGEPVVGMEIIDAVQLIRGEAGTTVGLTVLRPAAKGSGSSADTRLEVPVVRGEVVLKETRLETSYEPFGDGVLGYVKLYSFYEDPQYSSAADMAREISKMKQEHKMKGLVLDLRYNSGGLLTQAVAVTGLFITKGVVVSVKDNSGRLQRLRDTNGSTVWDGPLVVLTNRLSASAAEIVAQTLKDYGRPIIVGDEATFGKGTFQTFTLSTSGRVHPDGEYKVTRGRYYTVSGQSPQMTGVVPDIIVPGVLSNEEIGERHTKYPVPGDRIAASFGDDLDDVPTGHRQRIAELYRFDLQPRIDHYTGYLDQLRSNSLARIDQNRDYQAFLKAIKADEDLDEDNQELVADDEEDQNFGHSDLQLMEAMNILKDLVYLMEKQPQQQHFAKDDAA